MATEIVTSFPLNHQVPIIDYSAYWATAGIESRLKGLEEQLSRIEAMIAKALGPPRE